MKPASLGWVVSAGMIGLMAGVGFQAKSQKIAYVDISGVYDLSLVKKKNEDKLRASVQARQALLDFVSLNPSFTEAQLKRFRELGTKDTPMTPAEEAEFAKLKADAQADTKKADDLRQKQNPSAQELATLNDLSNRTDLDAKARATWASDFQQDFDDTQASLQGKAKTAIEAAIAQVAKAQNITIVFRETAAVYGSADIKNDVLKIVDKNTK